MKGAFDRPAGRVGKPGEIVGDCNRHGFKRTVAITIPRMEPFVPFLTWRFDLALQFASGLHHDQARKGGSVPYIAHLMGVCALVLEAFDSLSESPRFRDEMPKRKSAFSLPEKTLASVGN